MRVGERTGAIVSARFGDATLDADVLVIGSGVAGLATALGAAESWAGARVVLATKGRLASGSSPLAQGGLAAAVGADDAEELHAADTERVARGLGDSGMIRILTQGGPDAVERLRRHGARFDSDGTGATALGREAGHSRRRILHAGGDATGRELVRALSEAVEEHPAIRVEEELFVAELLVCGGAAASKARRVVGAVGWRDGRRLRLRSSATVLATGGYGQLYLRTTNPREVTGDGLAMAARAGALLADLEFVQFHPTSIDVDALRREDPDRLLPERWRHRAPLLTEALRGEGAFLVDDRGRRFMVPIHPDGELAPRDVVARALWQRLERGEPCGLDLRPLAPGGESGALSLRFPTAVAQCRELGLDPASRSIPVAPAAHYAMGGVWVDREGRTSLPGLWACGEVASTGVHGANRLASNSLLEGLVFGERVGSAAASFAAGHEAPGAEAGGGDGAVPPATDAAPLESLRRRIQTVMWSRAGLVRSASSLAAAAAELEALWAQLPEGPSEVRNLLRAGRLVVAAALQRRESRGAHYRSDHPEADPRWASRQLGTEERLLAGAARSLRGDAAELPVWARDGARKVG